MTPENRDDRCVDECEAEQLMHDVHDGTFGTHASGHVMSRKLLRAGYYWITMERDCYQYARKCHKCQVYADKIHVPPHALKVMSSPWPFSMWGIDMIGRIEPKASNGHRFILVAIDYFTKWVKCNTPFSQNNVNMYNYQSFQQQRSITSTSQNSV